MTTLPPDQPEPPHTFDRVLQQLKTATRYVELAEIRFLECRCGYGVETEPVAEVVEVTVRGQDVTIDERSIRSTLTADFRAPSPFSESETEKHKQVHVSARIEVRYESVPERETGTDESITTFARMNGVQAAWPYFREYVHSSLARMGLPPFDLPLLKPVEAARLAGLIGRPREDEAAQGLAVDSSALQAERTQP